MTRTLVKIDAKEKDLLTEICSLMDVPHTFYTIENNPLILQVEITATPAMIFHLARMVELKSRLNEIV